MSLKKNHQQIKKFRGCGDVNQIDDEGAALSEAAPSLYSISSVVAYLPLALLYGVLVSSASIIGQSLLQWNTQSEMAGRVFSISTLAGNSSLPLAYVLFGILLENNSPVPILIGAGITLFLMSSFLLLLYQRKRIDEPDQCLSLKNNP